MDMGVTLQHFMDKFNEFKTLPAGESFTIRLSQEEATAAAAEYLKESRAQVKQMLQKSTGIGLEVDDPMIGFKNDEIFLSAVGGKGFLKTRASLTADVKWEGKPLVKVRSVDVPLISVTPERLNFVVEKPLQQLTEKVREYADIHSFKLSDGFAVLEAVKK